MKEREKNLRLAALAYVEAKRALEHFEAPKNGPEFEDLIRAFRAADDEFEAAADAYTKVASEEADADHDALKDNLLIALVAERVGGEWPTTVTAKQIEQAGGMVLKIAAVSEAGITLTVERKQ